RFGVDLDLLTAHGFPSFRSDAEGFLNVPIIPAGTANGVRIAHRRYAEAEIPAMPADIEIDFPLPEGVRLVGHVAAPNGERVPGARISVFHPLESGPVEVAGARTGPDGFYSVLVPAGRYAAA